MSIKKYPQRIVVELTSRCNLSCHMCPRQHIKNIKKDMADELWTKLINDIAANSPGSIVIPFWRGEALLHPHFSKLVEYALNRFVRIHIATNGTIMNGKVKEALSRCEFVTFSVHNEIGYKNAKSFLNYRQGKYPITQVSFVEGESNIKKIHDRLVHSKNLEGFNGARIYEEHTKNGVFGNPAGESISRRAFCQKLKDTLVISRDGSISRCSYVWAVDRDVDLNAMDIKEAWASNCLKRIRNGYPDLLCKSCGQWRGHTRGELLRITKGKIEHKTFL